MLENFVFFSLYFLAAVSGIEPDEVALKIGLNVPKRIKMFLLLHKMSKERSVVESRSEGRKHFNSGQKSSKWIPALDSRAHSMSAMECYATPWRLWRESRTL